jgi:DNA-binding response OmpR family regulator
MRKLILLVDPDPHFRAGLRRLLEAGGFAVGEACSGEEGERTIHRVHVDAVIVDVLVESLVPGGSVAEKLKATGSRMPVYVFSEASIVTREDIDFTAMNIAGVFTRPLNATVVINTLKTRLKIS